LAQCPHRPPRWPPSGSRHRNGQISPLGIGTDPGAYESRQMAA
jgi:hypothetical protein